MKFIKVIYHGKESNVSNFGISIQKKYHSVFNFQITFSPNLIRSIVASQIPIHNFKIPILQSASYQT